MISIVYLRIISSISHSFRISLVKISIIIPFLGNDTYLDFYKSATKSVSYSRPGGYAFQCVINFSDVFPNTILGVTSVHKTGDAVIGAFDNWFDGIIIDKANRIIKIPGYGGSGGDVRNVSGTVTITAIGY